MDLKQPKKKLQLYKALKLGYTRDLNKQRKVLKKYGYIIDPQLTNEREHIVAFNPNDKKLLFVSQGTEPVSSKDIATDLLLAQGALKSTKRYNDDRNALLKAREKYKPEEKNIILAGHSLGGAIVNSLAPGKSQAYTYNAAFTPGQKARENVHNYRTQGDAISIFAPEKTTNTLANITNASATRPLNYLLKAHEVENIKDLPVFF